MRRTYVAVLLLVMAGCASPAEPETIASDDEAPEPQPPMLPEKFTRSISVTGGFEAAGDASGSPCSLQPWCFDYEFSSVTAVDLDAALSWAPAANDFDLYLFHGPDELARSNGHGAGSTEAIQMRLDPGPYVLRVVPHAVADADATLDVSFTAA